MANHHSYSHPVRRLCRMRYVEIVEVMIGKNRKPHQKPQSDEQDAREGKQEEEQEQRDADPKCKPEYQTEYNRQERPDKPGNYVDEPRTDATPKLVRHRTLSVVYIATCYHNPVYDDKAENDNH
jgi:hypothetical protein